MPSERVAMRKHAQKRLSSLSPFQQILVVFFGTLITLFAPTALILLSLGYLGIGPATAYVSGASSGGPFVRQESGGTFASAREIISTLEELGIRCWSTAYYTNDSNDQIAECTTNISKVKFIVGQPGDDTFRSRLENDPETKSINTLMLVGENWGLSTACDYYFGNRVKNAIGGKYLRERFVRPRSCYDR